MLLLMMEHSRSPTYFLMDYIYFLVLLVVDIYLLIINQVSLNCNASSRAIPVHCNFGNMIIHQDGISLDFDMSRLEH